MSVTPDIIKGAVVLTITVSCTVIAYSILRQLKISKTEEEVLVESVEAQDSVDAVEAFDLVAYLSDLLYTYTIEVQAAGIGLIAGAVAFKTIAADSLFILSITDTVNKGLSALSDLFSAKAPEVPEVPEVQDSSEFGLESSIPRLSLEDLSDGEVLLVSEQLRRDPDYNLVDALQQTGKHSLGKVDFLWDVSRKLGMPLPKATCVTEEPLPDAFLDEVNLTRDQLRSFLLSGRRTNWYLNVDNVMLSTSDYCYYLKQLYIMHQWCGDLAESTPAGLVDAVDSEMRDMVRTVKGSPS